MNEAQQIIDLMGGRKAVMEITGLTKGRISQWVSENSIPRYWLLEFHLRNPGAVSDPRRQEVSHA